jgi:hypothetical protein
VILAACAVDGVDVFLEGSSELLEELISLFHQDTTDCKCDQVSTRWICS